MCNTVPNAVAFVVDMVEGGVLEARLTDADGFAGFAGLFPGGCTNLAGRCVDATTDDVAALAVNPGDRVFIVVGAPTFSDVEVRTLALSLR
jgi:hypothetical protein